MKSKISIILPFLFLSVILSATNNLPELNLIKSNVEIKNNSYRYNATFKLPKGYSIKDLNENVCIFLNNGEKLKTELSLVNKVLKVSWISNDFIESFTLKYRLCTEDTQTCIMTQEMKLKFKAPLSSKKTLPLLFIFFSGILTALSPCVLPIIPLVFGFIGLSKDKKQGIINSLILIFTMALSYSLLGALTAKGGGVFGATLQKPIFSLIAGSVIILMGTSLMGLFEIQAPQSLMGKISGFRGKGRFAALIMGIFIGVIGMPCVGPVLISILTYISTTQNMGFGAFSLFLYALGMGIVFFVLSILSLYSGKKVKQGYWNEFLKTIFSFAIIGTGVYFIDKALNTNITWVIYFLFISFYLFKKGFSEGPKLFSRIYLILAVVSMIFPAYNFYTFIHKEYLTSEQIKSKNLNNFWLYNIEEAKDIAKKEDKIVVMDFFASWCEGCNELNDAFHSIYKDYTDKIIFVKVDLTSTNKKTISIAKEYKIRGLPTVLILCPKNSKKIERFSGALTERELKKVLDNAIKKSLLCEEG